MSADSNSDSIHFYEPSKGHGLPHDPLNAIIGPRPIGWVSTQGKDGTVNIAPYSFFNAFNYKPPIIGFASTGPKDSLRNIQETGEFVWNLVTRELAEKMNATSATVPYDVDEFYLAQIEKAESRIVAPPRVRDSAVNFECKMTQIHQLTTHEQKPVETWLILGEVVGVHIHPRVLKDGIFDTFGAGIILRAGGPGDYAMIRPESRFEMLRPK